MSAESLRARHLTHVHHEIVEFNPGRLIAAISTRAITGEPARTAAAVLMSASPAVDQCFTPAVLVEHIYVLHDLGLLQPIENAYGATT